VKIPSSIVGLIAGAFLTLSANSNAAPFGSGFHGGSFRNGFVPHGGTALRMGAGMRRNFKDEFGFRRNRFLFHRDHRFFSQQLIVPFYWNPYWYPYSYPYDYSYLDYGPDYDYQYWDNSAARVQPQSSRPAADRSPIYIIINTANSGPMNSSPNTGYISSGNGSTPAAGQQRIVTQQPIEKIEARADPATSAPVAVPQAGKTAPNGAPSTPQTQSGPFGNLVLVSWLEDAGKDVIYVRNTETNDVQKITTEPNKDNFRIVEVHPNTDPKLFEAVISNGNQQGPVRFLF
jgi:hypothetical protein